MDSFETSPSIEAKSEAVKKCTKLMLKCLKVCQSKKRLRKDNQGLSKEPKK